MRILYTFLLYLCVPFITLRLLWRSRRAPAYRRRISERFGFFEAPVLHNSIWVHAVSVGEVIAAAPLIKRLKQQHPHLPIVVTTMTPTGSEQVKKHFADFNKSEIFHVYAPYDLPDVIKRFLRHIKPRLVILMETELWPNILYYCHRAGIPTVVANARLSAKSAKGYARFAPFVRSMLANVSTVIAQTKADAERYAVLGMPRDRIIITGSVKFDLQIPASLSETAEILRQQWGVDRPVWIAASTHEGEEEPVLQAFAQILKTFPQTLLVLVPRHPERFNRVENLCRKHHYQVIRRSSGHTCSEETNVFLGDTLGELLLFYAASDVAFVGGSLSPIGGHNLLEPAAVGLPIVIGPYMFNFAEITRLLQEVGALTQIKQSDELATAVLSFLQDAQLRTQAGENGRSVVKKNRGALDAHLKILQTQIT